MRRPPPLPAELLRQWGAVPGPGEAWLEALAPLQYVAYGVRDASGRPLGELNAPPESREVLEAELRPAPYVDARAGMPMNVTALRHVRDHWPWVLESLATLRGAWSARFPETAEPMDLPHLWSFSASVMAMPIFLLRTGGASDGTLPPAVSGLFKVMQGVFVASWQLWLDMPAGSTDPEALTRAVLDRELLYNRRAGRVCPAPPGMIRELFEACTRPASTPDSADDAAALFAYGSTYAALSIEKWLVNAPPDDLVRRVVPQRDGLVGWTSGAPDRSEERITELQCALCRTCGVPAPKGEFDFAWIRRPV